MLTQVLPAQFQQWLASYAENGIKPVVLDVREPWKSSRPAFSPVRASSCAASPCMTSLHACRSSIQTTPLPACATMAHAA